MEYLYIRSNPDWDLTEKYKFGYVGSQEDGLVNRIKSSITEHSEYCKYVMIYGIEKENDYQGYQEFDKIFSILCRSEKNKHPLLKKFKKYLIGPRNRSEFMKKNGLELMEKIVMEVFPIFGLKCVKKFNEVELERIHKIAIEDDLIYPREYQEDTLTKMIRYYQDHNIGKLLWSCGLGKTLMSLFFVKQMRYRKICIGVPSVFLQKQFKDEIFFDSDCILINGESEIKKADMNRRVFYITTYASSKYLVRDDLFFDLKIGDEAHHLVNGYPSFHKIKSYKTLFMTATEKIVSEEIDDSFSMDNSEIFGEVIDSKNIKWSIQNNRITDYNILILRNDKDEVDQILSSLEDMDRNLFISCYLTIKALVGGQFPMLRHLLIYTNKRSNADKVVTYLDMLIKDKQDFYINSFHSGSKEKLETEIQKFKKSKFGIISCVYILGEGFNLPKLTGVVVAEKMESEIRIVQSCLRANRKDSDNPDKEAYIIIPSSEDNEADNFQKVKQVVGNFISSDEDVMMKIKCLGVSDLGKKKKKTIDRKDGEIRNEEQFEKLKLKLIKSGDFKSKMSYEEYEYSILRKFNRRMNILDVEGYVGSKERRDFFIDDPKTYFSFFGIWKNWYHFLGVDTSNFPRDKEEWKDKCRKLGIDSKKKYYKVCKLDQSLPLFPEELYYEFSGVDSELNFLPYIY